MISHSGDHPKTAWGENNPSPKQPATKQQPLAWYPSNPMISQQWAGANTHLDLVDTCTLVRHLHWLGCFLSFWAPPAGNAGTIHGRLMMGSSLNSKQISLFRGF